MNVSVFVSGGNGSGYLMYWGVLQVWERLIPSRTSEMG